MQFAVHQAQAIVDELGEIVRQKINMMDEKGFIIASTDVSRIGNFHEGAKKIIDENLPELYITAEEATADTRMGINLPLFYKKKIIGVIGITGAYDQVIGYGKVVKKMTEILIRERIQEDEKRLDTRVLSRFLEEWVLGNGMLRSDFLAERGRQLGIDIAVPRRIVVISMDKVENYIDTLEGQELIERIENFISKIIFADHRSTLILRNSARQILLLPFLDDEELYTIAVQLHEEVQKKFSHDLRIGIDGVNDNIHEAYLQADRAWRLGKYLPRKISLYGRLNIEMFLHEISEGTKFDYLEKLFKRYDKEEIPQVISLLETYFAADGSLSEMSKLMYLHKNTLQYKLKKLVKLTGYDVRQPKYAAIFYLAVLFFREIDNE